MIEEIKEEEINESRQLSGLRQSRQLSGLRGCLESSGLSGWGESRESRESSGLKVIRGAALMKYNMLPTGRRGLVHPQLSSDDTSKDNSKNNSKDNSKNINNDMQLSTDDDSNDNSKDNSYDMSNDNSKDRSNDRSKQINPTRPHLPHLPQQPPGFAPQMTRRSSISGGRWGGIKLFGIRYDTPRWWGG